MKVGVLFSGGKDSTFSIYKAKEEGHQVACILTIFPKSYESHLLHYPNIQLTKLQAESMNIPQITISVDSTNPNEEELTLEEILRQAKEQFQITGVVHGGILSDYQKKRFEKISSNLGISLISPIWKKNQKQYMTSLIDSNFKFIIISVTSGGLDDTWLGKEMTKEDLLKLEKLSEKHGFNLTFEGGEAETFVIDCPLFNHPIKIEKSRKIWDGYRGIFEIVEARLVTNA